MKKRLFLWIASVPVLLGGMACSGLGGQSPLGNEGEPCPDFSGSYEIGVFDPQGGLSNGDAVMTVTQSGENIVVELAYCNPEILAMSGTLDCLTGDFEASGPVWDGTMTMTGNLNEMSGALAWSNAFGSVESTWSAELLGYPWCT
jgi:hypothetical protein